MHDNLTPGRRNTSAKQSQDVELLDSKMIGHSPQSSNLSDQQKPQHAEANEQPVDILTFMGFKL